MALSVPQFVFLNELKQDLEADNKFQELRSRIKNDPVGHPGYAEKNGLILYQGRIWISPMSRFKSLLLKEFHETPIGGHAGIIKTSSDSHQIFIGVT
jgi:hypothetical protein